MALVRRVAVQLPADAPDPTDDPDGWALTPRARLEPALEGWARALLPAPGPLAALRLAALDAVAASPEQLAARAAGVTLDPDLGAAAAALRTLLVDARPLTGADLTPAAAPPAAVDE